MGIQIEFNPDLALRKYNTFGRLEAECLHQRLIQDEVYPFLKKGQRVYCLEEEIPLKITKGRGKLSNPKASIIILESTHFLKKEEVWTKGLYKIIEVFNDNEIHFNGCKRIK